MIKCKRCINEKNQKKADYMACWIAALYHASGIRAVDVRMPLQPNGNLLGVVHAFKKELVGKAVAVQQLAGLMHKLKEPKAHHRCEVQQFSRKDYAPHGLFRKERFIRRMGGRLAVCLLRVRFLG
ncbi:hypothetical protein Ancab_008259 [Ancistrocladus abbreviatus]